MRTRVIIVAVVAAIGCGQQVFAAPPALTVTDGLIYQLDATDSANLQYDSGTGAIVSWASSQGSDSGFVMTPSGTAPRYSATGGGNSNLPNVVFDAIGQTKLLQMAGGSTTPLCVFIMENTTNPGVLGGIWGHNGIDNGIRFWGDNRPEGEWGAPPIPGGSHQLVNLAIVGLDDRALDFGLNKAGSNGQPAGSENYYWSDTVTFDAKQAWQYKNWGTLGAYAYNNANHTWDATAMGWYREEYPPTGYTGPRAWGGGVGEVLAYDRYLSDSERQAVETYLANKWLVPEPATLSLLAIGGIGMMFRRRGLRR